MPRAGAGKCVLIPSFRDWAACDTLCSHIQMQIYQQVRSPSYWWKSLLTFLGTHCFLSSQKKKKKEHTQRFISTVTK